MRWWGWLLVGIVGLVAVGALWLYRQVTHLETARITDDVHVMYGLGGNVSVLRTGAGTVLVDSMTTSIQGARIRARAEALTGEPVVMVINTHYHLDHTHGNPAFDANTRIVSTRRTLHHLQVTDPGLANKPNETFARINTVRVGNKTVRMLHPGRGHTDGDLIVMFVEDGVLSTGDLFFNRYYPNIDLEAGGTVAGWGATLDIVLQERFRHVIPGHGLVSDRDGLRQFQRFMRQLADIGARAAADGTSLAATEASSALTEDAGYDEIRLIVPIGLDRAFVLRRAWEEATGNFTARD